MECCCTSANASWMPKMNSNGMGGGGRLNNPCNALLPLWTTLWTWKCQPWIQLSGDFDGMTNAICACSRGENKLKWRARRLDCIRIVVPTLSRRVCGKMFPWRSPSHLPLLETSHGGQQCAAHVIGHVAPCEIFGGLQQQRERFGIVKTSAQHFVCAPT